jgi:ubiquinone/menaquinone biosynthesis C-methylase UbiE
MNEQFAARIAEAYGCHSQKYSDVLEPILQPMANEIIGLAKLSGGEQILDLATGTGLIARTLAQFTDSVIGIDISLGVLGRAKYLSAGEIPFITGDAHRLPFKDLCFDLVTCGLSLSHFSDVSAALVETRRVLRSRGRFITSAWGSEGKNPSKAAAIDVRRRFLTDREVAFDGTFSEEVWADVERGSRTLRAAGFADVQVTTLQLSGEYLNHSDCDS